MLFSVDGESGRLVCLCQVPGVSEALWQVASVPGLPTVQFLIAAYCKQSKTGRWEGLGTKLTVTKIFVFQVFLFFLQQRVKVLSHICSYITVTG